MLLVIDTNILVNAFRGKRDSRRKSQKLLLDVYWGEHKVFVSSPIMEEYRDVLSREHLQLRKGLVSIWMWYVKHYAVFIEPNPSTTL